MLNIFALPIDNKAQIDTDIVLGKIVTLDSKILGEKRNIFVNLPVGYDNGEDSYPVIYILDGGGNFVFSSAIVNFLSRIQNMPRSIVIGIPNTDRTRDFTPTYVEESPTSGGADNFLEFLDKELLPYIKNNYRTQPYNILYGHSLCGMFSIYSMFTKPELFESYIAVSPYLMYDDEVVINKLGSTLLEGNDFKKNLFITLGNEPEYNNSIDRMRELISSKSKLLTFEIKEMINDNHNSSPLKSLYEGLEFIYPDWQLTRDDLNKGIESVKSHYNRLSKKYGYHIAIPEVTINFVGYQYLNNKQYTKAIEVFDFNIEQYPNSANVYDSLGEAFEKSGDISSAIKNYQIAVQKGEILKDRNLPTYKINLNRVNTLN